MTHPLTDSDGLYDPKVRDRKRYGHLMWLNGTDWQLEQVLQWLNENLSHYTDATSCRGLSPIHRLKDDLKEAMRPTTQGVTHDKKKSSES